MPTGAFYIDGFNLYNGCLSGSLYKWLDLEALCKLIAPGYSVTKVRYFTARMTGDKARRQQVYLAALSGSALVQVHTEGYFREHVVIRPVAQTPAKGMSAPIEYEDHGRWLPAARPNAGRWLRASVRDRKEKGTDVNLATMLLVDTYAKLADVAFVVSGDSDLQMPVAHCATMLPVTVVNPVSGRTSNELQRASTAYTTLSPAMLYAGQLPTVVKTKQGTTVTKPAAW